MTNRIFLMPWVNDYCRFRAENIPNFFPRVELFWNPKLIKLVYIRIVVDLECSNQIPRSHETDFITCVILRVCLVGLRRHCRKNPAYQQNTEISGDLERSSRRV